MFKIVKLCQFKIYFINRKDFRREILLVHVSVSCKCQALLQISLWISYGDICVYIILKAESRTQKRKTEAEGLFALQRTVVNKVYAKIFRRVGNAISMDFDNCNLGIS